MAICQSKAAAPRLPWLLQQFPVAVDDLHHNRAALVEPVMVLGREAVDAVDRRDLLLAFERLAQGDAELGRTRLRLLLRNRHHPLQDQRRVETVRREDYRRLVAELR